MNAQDIAKAAKVLQVNYDRKFTTDKLKLWLAKFEPFPVDVLVVAIDRHIVDPERGMFFPTIADIFKQLVYSDAKIKTLAAQAFDDDPGIDGTDRFTIANEKYFDRAQRKRQYIAKDLEDWHEWSIGKQLSFSKAITPEQAKMIDDNIARLEHHAN